ncbi:MAG: hypothetical protein J5J00_08455 [Deltaproteobacteria bacterium]|nr:hypothetical protein [Deltaproteobacteria bacterium]
MTLLTFGEALWASFITGLERLMAFLPQLLGAIILLVIGWVIAGVVARLTVRALRAAGVERAADKSAIGDFVRSSGTRWSVVEVFGELVKWFLRLIFIQAAASILAMPQVTTIINSIILFIPNVAVAIALLVFGSVIARFVSGTVRASVDRAGIRNPDRMAAISRWAIMAFAVVAAISQLGIAPVIVHTLFIGLVGAVALSVGLAFGLGGREVASELTHTWFERGRGAFINEGVMTQPGEVLERRPH